jgi:hypothetical protein
MAKKEGPVRVIVNADIMFDDFVDKPRINALYLVHMPDGSFVLAQCNSDSGWFLSDTSKEDRDLSNILSDDKERPVLWGRLVGWNNPEFVDKIPLKDLKKVAKKSPKKASKKSAKKASKKSLK